MVKHADCSVQFKQTEKPPYKEPVIKASHLSPDLSQIPSFHKLEKIMAKSGCSSSHIYQLKGVY